MHLSCPTPLRSTPGHLSTWMFPGSHWSSVVRHFTPLRLLPRPPTAVYVVPTDMPIPVCSTESPLYFPASVTTFTSNPLPWSLFFFRRLPGVGVGPSNTLAFPAGGQYTFLPTTCAWCDRSPPYGWNRLFPTTSTRQFVCIRSLATGCPSDIRRRPFCALTLFCLSPPIVPPSPTPTYPLVSPPLNSGLQSPLLPPCGHLVAFTSGKDGQVVAHYGHM